MLVAFVFFGIVVALVGGNFSIFPSAIFLGFLCIPVLIGIVFAVIALSGAASRRAIPPPPPIQQPMVRAGQQAPIALDCPNCGGPPTNVDRFGIATCSYCGTRYLVR